jgi:hypothetical protein
VDTPDLLQPGGTVRRELMSENFPIVILAVMGYVEMISMTPLACNIATDRRVFSLARRSSVTSLGKVWMHVPQLKISLAT